MYSQNKKRKILRWFEQTFASVSGDDQLLQLDEFTRALHISGVAKLLFTTCYIIIYYCMCRNICYACLFCIKYTTSNYSQFHGSPTRKGVLSSIPLLCGLNCLTLNSTIAVASYV